MEHKRAMEILNNVVNYVSVANNTPEQIEELTKYGFEPEELVKDFGYLISDVASATGEFVSEESGQSVSDIQKDINEFVKTMEEKYGKIINSSSLTSIMYDFINNSMVAYKVWNTDDIASVLWDADNLSYINEKDVDDIVSKAVDILKSEETIDTLEDCSDKEWNVIEDAVMKAVKAVDPKITVTEIDWDTDGEEISDLPYSVEIPYQTLEKNGGDIAECLSVMFDFCPNSFIVEGLKLTKEVLK